MGPVSDGHRVAGARPIRRLPGREHPLRRQQPEGHHGRGGGGRQASQHPLLHRVFAAGEFIDKVCARK